MSFLSNQDALNKNSNSKDKNTDGKKVDDKEESLDQVEEEKYLYIQIENSEGKKETFKFLLKAMKELSTFIKDAYDNTSNDETFGLFPDSPLVLNHILVTNKLEDKEKNKYNLPKFILEKNIPINSLHIVFKFLETYVKKWESNYSVENYRSPDPNNISSDLKETLGEKNVPSGVKYDDELILDFMNDMILDKLSQAERNRMGEDSIYNIIVRFGLIDYLIEQVDYLGMTGLDNKLYAYLITLTRETSYVELSNYSGIPFFKDVYVDVASQFEANHKEIIDMVRAAENKALEENKDLKINPDYISCKAEEKVDKVEEKVDKVEEKVDAVNKADDKKVKANTNVESVEDVNNVENSEDDNNADLE